MYDIVSFACRRCHGSTRIFKYHPGRCIRPMLSYIHGALSSPDLHSKLASLDLTSENVSKAQGALRLVTWLTAPTSIQPRLPKLGLGPARLTAPRNGALPADAYSATGAPHLSGRTVL